MKRKIDARRRTVLNIYHLLKNRNSKVIVAKVMEPVNNLQKGGRS